MRTNRILNALPEEILHRLGRLDEVAIEPRDNLELPGERIEHAYFVESGLVSIVGSSGNRLIEVGMIGFEGMTATAAVLGSDQAVCGALVQSAGTAMRVPVARLREAMALSPQATSLFLRYSLVQMIQASQTALANGKGVLGERLARWILMWQDRLCRDELVVTHEFLALLLGVRRPGVTVALHLLEGAKLIRSTRTLITIRDRTGLKKAAKGFYGVPEAEYSRLIGEAA